MNVLIEKYKPHDYVDKNGFYTWVNKYDDVIKQKDKNGNSIIEMKVSIPLQSTFLANVYGIDYQFELEKLIVDKIKENLKPNSKIDFIVDNIDVENLQVSNVLIKTNENN